LLDKERKILEEAKPIPAVPSYAMGTEELCRIRDRGENDAGNGKPPIRGPASFKT